MTVSIGLGPNFFTCSGLGLVSQLMGWVGSVTQNGPMDGCCADHLRHFAATCFSLLQQLCTVSHRILCMVDENIFLLVY